MQEAHTALVALTKAGSPKMPCSVIGVDIIATSARGGGGNGGKTDCPIPTRDFGSFWVTNGSPAICAISATAFRYVSKYVNTIKRRTQ
jgi:hypothetical protein